jgi:hypothetical protein
LLVPSDNAKIVSLLNFNDIGANSLVESNAFKKIRLFTKSNNNDLFNSYSYFNNKFNNFAKIVQLEPAVLDSSAFNTKRQISFLNSSNFLANSGFFLDANAVKKLIA